MAFEVLLMEIDRFYIKKMRLPNIKLAAAFETWSNYMQ